MNIVEDVRKSVTNPKPLYFVAGVGDAVVEAVKDAPARLNAASAKASEYATVAAAKVAGVAETVQSKIALGELDPKALRERLSEPDLRAVREKTQIIALSQVGRALELAGKAVETYDGLSAKGKAVVDKALAGRMGTDVDVVTVQDVAGKGGRETVVVDEVVVLDEVKAAKEEAAKAEAAAAATAAKPAPAQPKAEAKAAAPKADVKAEAKAANNSKPATPRRKADDAK